jgi:hypothetical protein
MSSFWCRLMLAGSEICRALVVLVGSPKLVGGRVWHSRFSSLDHWGIPFDRYQICWWVIGVLAVFDSAVPRVFVPLAMSPVSSTWLQFGRQMKVLVSQQRLQR